MNLIKSIFSQAVNAVGSIFANKVIPYRKEEGEKAMATLSVPRKENPKASCKSVSASTARHASIHVTLDRKKLVLWMGITR